VFLALLLVAEKMESPQLSKQAGSVIIIFDYHIACCMRVRGIVID